TGPGVWNGAQDGGVPERRAGRGVRRARARRPGAAFDPDGAVHLRGRGNDGGGRRGSRRPAAAGRRPAGGDRDGSGPMSLVERFDAVIMHTYPKPELGLLHGKGAVLTDTDGREYLDFVAGVAVNALGQAHPAIVEAVSRQIRTLG